MTRILPTPADSIVGLVCPSAAEARGYVRWRVDGFLYEQGITIEAHAASKLLADHLEELLPGMVVHRKTLFRGYLMRREPRSLMHAGT